MAPKRALGSFLPLALLSLCPPSQGQLGSLQTMNCHTAFPHYNASSIAGSDWCKQSGVGGGGNFTWGFRACNAGPTLPACAGSHFGDAWLWQANEKSDTPCNGTLYCKDPPDSILPTSNGAIYHFNQSACLTTGSMFRPHRSSFVNVTCDNSRPFWVYEALAYIEEGGYGFNITLSAPCRPNPDPKCPEDLAQTRAAIWTGPSNTTSGAESSVWYNWAFRPCLPPSILDCKQPNALLQQLNTVTGECTVASGFDKVVDSSQSQQYITLTLGNSLRPEDKAVATIELESEAGGGYRPCDILKPPPQVYVTSNGDGGVTYKMALECESE